MVQPNDWRLTSQENYLKNVELVHKNTATNDYWCICRECFDDFKEMFGWKVVGPQKLRVPAKLELPFQEEHVKSKI